jgi:hypothetical protein
MIHRETQSEKVENRKVKLKIKRKNLATWRLCESVKARSWQNKT